METVTHIEIYADLIGAYWWPMGETWEKLGVEFDISAYERRCIGGDRNNGGLSLRQAVDSFVNEHSGDSSNGVEISDGILIVTRRNGSRSKTRSFPLNMFPSIADYMHKESE